MEDNGRCIYFDAVYCPDIDCPVHGSPLSSEEAIQRLRRRLTGYPEGVGRVTFYRTDGATVVLDNVRYDEIGVDARMTKRGVVSVTMEDESIRHLPFVESWKVDF